MKADRTPLQVLITARHLISDPDHWAQGELQVERPSKLDGPQTCYCALGAIAEAEGIPVGACTDSVYTLLRTSHAVAVLGVLPEIKELMHYNKDSRMPLLHQVDAIWRYNDRNSHEKVLAMFDHAIQVAREADHE